MWNFIARESPNKRKQRAAAALRGRRFRAQLLAAHGRPNIARNVKQPATAPWHPERMTSKRPSKEPEPLDSIAPLLIGVQTHPERDVSLESLAREWGYSPSHFHRLFTETVGETPKAHVERVRLERAAMRVAVEGSSFLEIALAVGFRNPETFTRAFKRRFGMAPTAYRRFARRAQKERMERMQSFRGDGCTLSETTFLTLKPMTLLAVRRIGPYYDYSNLPPFSVRDGFWPRIAAHAERRDLAYRRLPIAIPYDNPTMTPPHLQHLDACLPLVRAADGEGDIKRLDFAGGLYGAIEHRGPYETIDQAYRTVADGIRRSGRFSFRAGAAGTDLPRMERARRSDRESHRGLLSSAEEHMTIDDSHRSASSTRVALMLSALLIPAFSIAQAPAGAGAPVVYFSLFGPDGSALQRFYRAVFDWQVTDSGDVATTVTPPLTGTIAAGCRGGHPLRWRRRHFGDIAEGRGQRRFHSLSAIRGSGPCRAGHF